MSIASHAVESEALGQPHPNLKDSNNSAKDDDTDIIIKNMLNTSTPNSVLLSPIDQSVTPENSQKEKINISTRVLEDKQVKNQSSKGNTNQKKKSPANNLSKSAVTEIMTGYEVLSPEKNEHIHNIIAYEIPYTWSPEKITAELKL
ncbi:hypothetical protein C1646_775174 [Rhizophagus diaphanus]|nr:hypothetical protein C1646_775174 [Rhizophagus diaphanus] [Rhizophagus sp. MUCL 43196]